MKDKKIRVLGLDLAALEHRESALCLMDESMKVKSLLLKKDEEILNYIFKKKPHLIAIDAPLNFAKSKGFRSCDREVIKLGIRLFPPDFGYMKQLTLRGIKIKELLEASGFKVIEVFPGAFKQLLKIPRKDKTMIRETLINLGVKRIREDVSLDELDAIIAAIVALLYLKDKSISLGDNKEGQIVIPKLKELEAIKRGSSLLL
ncbi:MAG: DUF429 domain-containing protein [Nitrososphaerales archaeon]